MAAFRFEAHARLQTRELLKQELLKQELLAQELQFGGP
jgi:hypothetical protein